MAIPDNTDTDNKKTVKNQYTADIIALEKIVGNQMLKDFGIENEDTMILLAPQLFSNQYYEGMAWYQWLIESSVSINSAWQTRLQSILQTEWEILPGGEEAQDQDALALIETVLYKYLNADKLFQDMLTALPFGFSVVEANYDFVGNYLVPLEAHFKKQVHFRFFPDGLRWIDKQDGNLMTGEKLPQNKFIIHNHLGTYENPYGMSIFGVRTLWLFFIRSELLKQYLRYTDSYGKPFPVLTLPDSIFNDAQQKKLATNIASDSKKTNYMILKEGMKYELVQAQTNNADIFLKGIEYCESMIVKNILGQSTTSSDQEGGSFAKSKTAKEISDTIIRADCIELATTINKFIKVVCDFNFSNLQFYPYIKFKTDPEENLKIKVDTWKIAYDMGMPIQKTQIAEVLNIIFDPSVPEDDILVRSGDQPTLPVAPTTEDTEENPEGEIDAEVDMSKNEAYLKFARAQINNAEDDMRLVDRWSEEATKKGAKLFKPIYEDIGKLIGTLDSKSVSKIKQFKPDPKLQSKFTDQIFNDIAFNFFYGAWAAQRNSYDPDQRYAAGSVVDMTLELMPFAEALEYFKDRIPYLLEDIENLTKELRAKAFWIGRSMTIEATKKVLEKLREAIQLGLSPEEWIDTNYQEFEALGFVEDIKKGCKASYLELVYRNQFAAGHMAGQWKQMQTPFVKKIMKYGQYIAIRDARTRPNHLAFHQRVYRMDDPIVNHIYPPNGHRCRCTWVWFSERQLDIYHLTPQQRNTYPVIGGAKMMPDKGWNTNQAAQWLASNPTS